MSLHCGPVALTVVLAVTAACRAESSPGIVDLNTLRTFPEIKNASDWKGRAEDIRDQVRASCGLWITPPKTSRNLRILGREEFSDFTVEKVLIQTFPGFYLGGNLYRPVGKKGPFPAILSPHGHWNEGRLANSEQCSIRARCISFARQGMIAFSYDMVGYNDSCFPGMPGGHRSFATNRADLLWNVSLMGLQTWNSICALDFLESLPDANPKRLACTGESGGGTQTFMLGAIDRRLAAQAPVVMVSHSMQGGCLCENAPGLRVRFSNMEIAASAAPRPQMLVGASGDWTRDTMQVEGPSVAAMYDLLRAREHFDFTRFDFGHNYNRTSREAVYRFFGRYLLDGRMADALREQTIPNIPDQQLRVLPEGSTAPGMITQNELIAAWKEHQSQWWDQALATGEAGKAKFRQNFEKFWRHILQMEPAVPALTVSLAPEKAGVQEIRVRPSGGADEITAALWLPEGTSPKHLARVLVLAEASDSAESSFIRAALGGGAGVLQVKSGSPVPIADRFVNFYSVYNRTPLQTRARDLVAACAVARQLAPGARVILAGIGGGGIPALMAGFAADGLAADANDLGNSNETDWLKDEWFCPGILSVGGIEGALLMTYPRPVFICRAPVSGRLGQIEKLFGKVKSGRPHIENSPVAAEELAAKALAL